MVQRLATSFGTQRQTDRQADPQISCYFYVRIMSIKYRDGRTDRHHSTLYYSLYLFLLKSINAKCAWLLFITVSNKINAFGSHLCVFYRLRTFGGVWGVS